MTPQPCPFCGGINILQEGYHLFCYTCGANGPDADNDDDEERAAAWNTRAALASSTIYEARLRDVLSAVQDYLPPDGIRVQVAMNRIIEAVDPWPIPPPPVDQGEQHG